MLENLPAFQVTKWTPDFFGNVVSLVTGSFLNDTDCEKDHTLYLCSYLGHLNAKTVVLEGSYIDQNYLDDYQKYYSSCFPHHPKCCTRLHFFSSDFNESQFISAVKGMAPNDFNKKLKKCYLGYIVIRPIPETFIARLCLISYKRTKTKKYKLIRKDYSVNLFGLKLPIAGALFTEKDRVVSACATSSIWTLLCSSSHYDRNSYPSPSSITKTALNRNELNSQGFPVLGLSPSQVCSAIQSYGLEAKEIPLPSNDQDKCFDLVKNYSTAYITNEISYILAGKIYHYNNDTKKITPIGDHAICVLGYRYNGRITFHKNRSKNLSKLYAHDDRYGPYLALKFPDKKSKGFEVVESPIQEERKEQRKKIRRVKGLEISFDKSGNSKGCDLNEVFIPNHIILAKHHKARIPLDDAERLIDIFFRIVSLLDSEKSILKKELLNYELKLFNSNDLKTECRKSSKKSTTYFYFNGNEEKSSFLCKSLPKHIWLCSIYDNNLLIGEILLDATEAIQGKPLIGYIAYTKEFNAFWVQLAKPDIFDHLHRLFKDLHNKDILNSFVIYLKFLKGSENLFLNISYGETKVVQRAFKTKAVIRANEVDGLGTITVKPDVHIIKFKSNWSPKYLNMSAKYIWLIDEYGNLYYGIENEDNDVFCTGHPTLNSGRPSRLAGELVYKNGRWEINLASAAYSGHLTSEEDRKERLSVVLEFNFNGWSDSDKPTPIVKIN